MKEKKENTVQNQFTAYLVTAIKNTRIRYMERKYRLKEREYICEDIDDKSSTSFEDQFDEYIYKQTIVSYDEPERLQEVLKLIESEKVIGY